MIFYIYSTHPEFGDEMNRYEWEEMVYTFGQDGAESLRDGFSIFANGRGSRQRSARGDARGCRYAGKW